VRVITLGPCTYMRMYMYMYICACMYSQSVVKMPNAMCFYIHKCIHTCTAASPSPSRISRMLSALCFHIHAYINTYIYRGISNSTHRSASRISRMLSALCFPIHAYIHTYIHTHIHTYTGASPSPSRISRMLSAMYRIESECAQSQNTYGHCITPANVIVNELRTNQNMTITTVENVGGVVKTTTTVLKFNK
jgi:hypothetical protein